jgi:hypothetical protein
MESIVADLADMFPDVVGWQTVTTDAYGTETLGTLVNLPAIVSGRIRTIIGSDGIQRTSTVRVTFAGVFGVGPNDVYTLPVRFTPRQPNTLAVNYATDENGAHHEQVFF